MSATGTCTVTDELAVVALGGGHGLASTLRAARQYATTISGVASVADDGGSTGKLRRELGVPAPGDLRKCLVALAADEHDVWPTAFEHRFSAGELENHALGNLMIVGLAESLGDFEQALQVAGELLGAVGRVLPATLDPVVLKAEVAGRAVEGQVAVQNAQGRIRRVELIPADARATPSVIDAIGEADQIVLAPGSLYTSLLPVLCVRGIRDALRASTAPIVQVCNLAPQLPETEGLDATDHLRAVCAHGTNVDSFVYQGGGRLESDDAAIEALGVRSVAADVSGRAAWAHDPAKLARVLRALL
jgi:uncharacterized cofD-like protein